MTPFDNQGFCGLRPLDPCACGAQIRSWRVYEGFHASVCLWPFVYTDNFVTLARTNWIRVSTDLWMFMCESNAIPISLHILQTLLPILDDLFLLPSITIAFYTTLQGMPQSQSQGMNSWSRYRCLADLLFAFDKTQILLHKIIITIMHNWQNIQKEIMEEKTKPN